MGPVAGILFVESRKGYKALGYRSFETVSVPLPGFYLLKVANKNGGDMKLNFSFSPVAGILFVERPDRPNRIRERILPTVFVNLIFTFLKAPLIATSSQLRGHLKLNYKIFNVLAFLSTLVSFGFTSVHENYHKPIALPCQECYQQKNPISQQPGSLILDPHSKTTATYP